MNHRGTWRRGLAGELLTLSAILLPPAQSSWAAVMRSEVRHIADDRDALSWALGTVRAGVAERLRAWQLQRLLSARSIGILWIVIFFAASLYLSLRSDAAAFRTFCCALALSLAAWLYQLGIPAYAQAISSPHRLRIGMCFALTAAILSALRFGRAPSDRLLRRLHK